MAPQEHAKSIAYGKDPSIDFDKDDQETYHESWVKSPYGCQYYRELSKIYYTAP